jgi:hypothetical protein
MPIVSADLGLFASVNMPDTDAGTPNGGAIDLLRRMDYTQLAANDDVEVISTAAGDTQSCTITGRKADGTLASETKALTGVTAAIFSTMGIIERVLTVELASVAVGTITVRRSPTGATIGTIPIGERGFMALFRKTASDPSSTVNVYTKGFWRNGHATLALLNAKVKQNADPDARITHLLANATADSATSTNRITAPAAASTQDPDTFDDLDKSVPGTDLAAVTAIGVWFRLQLPAADSPHRTTYTSELAGESV